MSVIYNIIIYKEYKLKAQEVFHYFPKELEALKPMVRTISVESTLALSSLDVSAKAVQVQGPPTDLPLPEAIHHSKSLLPICKKKCHHLTSTSSTNSLLPS
jgi:hypothetical protein